MKSFRIDGGHSLSGKVTIGGSKNAALALIPCALLTKQKVVLHDVPQIKDIFQQIEILKKLNVNVKYKNHTLTINSSNLQKCDLTFEEMKTFRASYYFYGALLPIFKNMKVVAPGGCKLGVRPIDLHLFALEKMGVSTRLEGKVYDLIASEQKQAYICFPKVSMGATINALLYANSINGTVVIENYSREPEVFEVINMLSLMGEEIHYDEEMIVVVGGKKLHGCTYNVIGDRIEAGTFILLGAALGRNLKIYNVNRAHLESLFKVLDELEISYLYKDHCIEISKEFSKHSLTIETGPYPAFPSDLQPLLTSYLLTIPHIHLIKETIYDDRFSHIKELSKCGAKIELIGQSIVINGDNKLIPSKLIGSDLRATAALVLIALIIKGRSYVKGVEFMERGYEDFVNKINSIGGHISLVEEDFE